MDCVADLPSRTIHGTAVITHGTAVIAHGTAVIARLDRAIQYSVAPVIRHERRGVLDHPLSRMMTAECVAGLMPRSSPPPLLPAAGHLSFPRARTHRRETGGRSGR